MSIPRAVTSIQSGAFEACSGLRKVQIPEQVGAGQAVRGGQAVGAFFGAARGWGVSPVKAIGS